MSGSHVVIATVHFSERSDTVRITLTSISGDQVPLTRSSLAFIETGRDLATALTKLVRETLDYPVPSWDARYGWATQDVRSVYVSPRHDNRRSLGVVEVYEIEFEHLG